MMTLDSLPLGQNAIIVRVGGEGMLRRRLLDMGLIPKTKVHMRKIAPMGDPLGLCLRGYELTLRREDAKKIEILPSADCGCSSCGAEGRGCPSRRSARK